uniref:Metallo-beta-lactamase domain-containing protein n=1 Tax=Tetradesmus obliquus TaxID=3088 RepID=A0A383W828_TETOB|eukprot:jgi/Sobl393_1/3275/SZX73795.1
MSMARLSRSRCVNVSAVAGSTSTPGYAYQKVQKDNREPRAENVAGNFWVDHTCIDCDTCRMMAPETYSRMNDQSAVHQQPSDRKGRVRALQALLSCPTYSIHVNERSAEELKEAQAGMPLPVPGTANCYSCGWRSEKTFGGEGFLITRPQGNVLVDAPRFNPVLAKRIAEMGGIKYMFLTHKDDVGDHERWAKHFNAQRILHADEVVPDTQAVEVKLTGEGPWQLPDGSDDITLIFTPGHTEAHVCLYYAPDKALFSGDHLSAGYTPEQELYVFKDFNWYSVPRQLESMRQLLQYDWLHVLPCHGRPVHLRDALHRLQAMNELLVREGLTPELQPAAVSS